MPETELPAAAATAGTASEVIVLVCSFEDVTWNVNTLRAARGGVPSRCGLVTLGSSDQARVEAVVTGFPVSCRDPIWASVPAARALCLLLGHRE